LPDVRHSLAVGRRPGRLSWNPPVTGKVGRIIEIYNPNPWMTFGGMGSKKLIGENIEYIANYDSHPGAQFNSEFRNLVRSEIAKFTANDRLEIPQAAVSRPNKPAQLPQSARLKPAEERMTHQQRGLAAKDHIQVAQTDMPKLPKRAQPEHVAEEPPKQQYEELTTFLDTLSSSVNSGDLFVQRRLTTTDLKDYAERTYHGSSTANLMAIASD
jgi:hypothetical protein